MDRQSQHPNMPNQQPYAQTPYQNQQTQYGNMPQYGQDPYQSQQPQYAQTPQYGAQQTPAYQQQNGNPYGYTSQTPNGPTMTMDGQVAYSFEKARSTSITRAYAEMTLALLLTAAVAILSDVSGIYMAFTTATGNLGWIILSIVQIGIAIYMSARIMKIGSGTARALFYGYAALTGFTLGSIFFTYNLGSVGLALLMTAGLFFVLTMLSLTTRKDMLKAGPILFAALIVLIIGELILMFVAPTNTTLMVTSAIGLVIFAGLTMYDAQQTRQLFAQAQATGDAALMDKISIISSFNLYLDFINMFLYLLQLFGDSDN